MTTDARGWRFSQRQAAGEKAWAKYIHPLTVEEARESRGYESKRATFLGGFHLGIIEAIAPPSNDGACWNCNGVGHVNFSTCIVCHATTADPKGTQ